MIRERYLQGKREIQQVLQNWIQLLRAKTMLQDSAAAAISQRIAALCVMVKASRKEIRSRGNMK